MNRRRGQFSVSDRTVEVENDFRWRDLSRVSPKLGEMKRLSPRQKAWGLVTGTPEAFFLRNPIISQGVSLRIRTLKGAIAQAEYVSRNGELTLIDSEGRRRSTPALVQGALRGWCLDNLAITPTTRVVDHLVLGVNGEAEREGFERACLSWCQAHLQGFPWLIGFHYDRPGHTHAHVLLRHRNWDTGAFFRLTPWDCDALREDLAARFVEAGVSANATSRATRGVFGPTLRYAQRVLHGGKLGPEVKAKIEAEARQAIEAKEVIEPAADRGRLSRAQVFSYAKGLIEHELKPSDDPEDLELARRLEAYYRALPPVRGLVESRALEIIEERRREAERLEKEAEAAEARRDRGGPER